MVEGVYEWILEDGFFGWWGWWWCWWVVCGGLKVLLTLANPSLGAYVIGIRIGIGIGFRDRV